MASPVFVNGLSGVQGTPIFVRDGGVNVQGYHFYDSLVAPTVGTTVPVWCGVLPTLTNSSHDFAQAAGIYFHLGLWVAAATAINGNTNPSAAVVINLAMS